MSAPTTTGYRQQFVAAGDLRLHYAEVGEATRPMVLLHGIGMDWRVWQAVSRRLRPHFHLYMVDLRGHGESDKPAHGYTLPHYAADIEDLIDFLGLKDVVLVGSSLGGMMAAAVEAPTDIVSHRILVDPPLTGGPVRDPAQFEDILRLKHQPPAALVDYLRRLNPGAGLHLLRVMSEMWHEAADGVITDMLEHRDDYFAIDGALRANDSPTLLMRADPTMFPALTEERAVQALALLPHGREVVVEGAGHAVHAYKPAEFVRLVLDFAGGTAA